MKEKGLDPKIRDLVLGLRTQGISTTMSCEGHCGDGFPYPWVDVVAEDAERLLQLVREYNIQVYSGESQVTWVILPRGELRILPEQRELSKEVLQESAVEFGKFLQTRGESP